MHFRKNVFSIFAATIVLTAFCASQSAAEEEKSLWQRFVDWFKPAPSLEGEGPLYDELRELDVKIDRTEGRYSRERRPGNKTRLKKELEDLKIKREKLVEKILEEEKAKKNAPVVQSVAASSSATAADTSKAASNAPTNNTPLTDASTGTSASSAYHSASLSQAVCAHDTVFVRDTVIVHDTLYVIVTGKPSEQQAPAAQSNTAQPAGNASPADSGAVQPTK